MCGREDRLVLAAQEAGDLGAQTPEDETVGIDDVPVVLDLACFRCVRGHRATSDPVWATWQHPPIRRGRLAREPGKDTARSRLTATRQVVRVSHRPQDEARGWGDLAGDVAVAGAQDRRQLARRTMTEPDVDQRADDAAHHLVAERRRPDLEPQHRRVVEPRPPEVEHTTHETRRRFAVGHLRPPAERGEVVLADQRVAGRLHRPEGERLGHVPRRPRLERVRRRVVPHVVAVVPAAAPRTGRRSRGSPTPRPRTAISGPCSLLIRRARSARSVSSGRSPTDDLAPRVHAGVGAAGAGQLDRRANDERDRRRELAEHGAHADVRREPVEVGPVVRDQEPRAVDRRSHGSSSDLTDQLRCAPSWRCRLARVPTFRIRV